MPIVTEPPGTVPVTGGDLLNITRNRYLLAGLTEPRNRLAAPYAAGGTNLTFEFDLKGIKPGSILSVGLNTFYVWSTDDSTKTAVVEPGYRGSNVEDAPFQAVVDVNPRYSIYDIFAALNEEIVALSSPGVGLFTMRQTELTYNSTLVGYDLPGVTDLTDIYEVRYTEPGPWQDSPRLSRDLWTLERNNLSSEFSSGMSLKLRTGAIFPGRTVTVLYRSGFTPFTSLADAMNVSGLPINLQDIPPMGAALRLGVGQEIRRNQIQSQGDTRRAEEVGAGAVNQSFNGLRGAYQRRVNDEIRRLQSAYPPSSSR